MCACVTGLMGAKAVHVSKPWLPLEVAAKFAGLSASLLAVHNGPPPFLKHFLYGEPCACKLLHVLPLMQSRAPSWVCLKLMCVVQTITLSLCMVAWCTCITARGSFSRFIQSCTSTCCSCGDLAGSVSLAGCTLTAGQLAVGFGLAPLHECALPLAVSARVLEHEVGQRLMTNICVKAQCIQSCAANILKLQVGT